MNDYYEFWKRHSIEDISAVRDYDDTQLTDYFNRSIENAKARHAGIKKYGFAVPNKEAIDAIAGLDRPIVEIGAGLAYWAYLLRQNKVDIVAYDNKTWHDFDYSKSWTEVIKGDCTNLREHSDRVLFTCWPDFYLPLAEECYKGDTMIWIGEECCDEYSYTWEIEKIVDIPQWYGLHDQMHILKRK